MRFLIFILLVGGFIFGQANAFRYPPNRVVVLFEFDEPTPPPSPPRPPLLRPPPPPRSLTRNPLSKVMDVWRKTYDELNETGKFLAGSLVGFIAFGLMATFVRLFVVIFAGISIGV